MPRYDTTRAEYRAGGGWIQLTEPEEGWQPGYNCYEWPLTFNTTTSTIDNWTMAGSATYGIAGSGTVNNITVTNSADGWHSLTYSGQPLYTGTPVQLATDQAILDSIVRPETDIQRAAREQRNTTRTDAARAASVRRAVATDRAIELLMSLLTERQQHAYLNDRYFDVIGSEGNIFRIGRGISGNVLWIDEMGRVLGRLCAHPTMRHDWLPEPDVHAAQLLAITTNERGWVQMANVHAGGRPNYAPIQNENTAQRVMDVCLA